MKVYASFSLKTVVKIDGKTIKSVLATKKMPICRHCQKWLMKYETGKFPITNVCYYEKSTTYKTINVNWGWRKNVHPRRC